MSETEAMRTGHLQQAETYGSKIRFGLFSSPVPVAVGDDGQYKSKLHPKDEAGKPVTKPRGFYTNPTRSGQLRKSYLGNLNSLAAGQIKDEYVDPDRKLLQIENEVFKNGYSKDQMFKPAGKGKEEHKPAYTYKEEDNPERDPKRNREEDGRVKAAPRNFYTNQQSTVIKSYFKPIKYMEDPYERADQLESEHAKKMKSKQHGEMNFKLNSHAHDTFNSRKNVYGTDIPEFPEKKPADPKFNIYKHQNRWKSNNANKSGLYGYFMPFPQWKEDPPKETTRKPKDENKKESFRRMSVTSSRPSPSITRTNIARTISHSVSYGRR